MDQDERQFVRVAISCHNSAKQKIKKGTRAHKHHRKT
jgi:hypothetical protein